MRLEVAPGFAVARLPCFKLWIKEDKEKSVIEWMRECDQVLKKGSCLAEVTIKTGRYNIDCNRRTGQVYLTDDPLGVLTTGFRAAGILPSRLTRGRCAEMLLYFGLDAVIARRQ